MIRNVLRLGIGSIVASLLLLGSLGCASPEADSRDSRARTFEIPHPPANLEQLEDHLQDQFQERYNLAIRLRDDPRANDSGRSWALGRLGQWLFAHREMSAARLCFEQAHLLDPNEYRWLYLLGQVQRLDGEFATSSSTLEQVLSLRPGDVPTLVWLGENALVEQRFEAAEPFFQEALTHDPQTTQAFAGLARVALERGDPQTAIAFLESGLKLQPNATQLLYTLGSAWRQAGDLEQAKIYFAQVPDDDMARVAIDLADPLLQEVSELRQGAQIDARLAAHAISRGHFQVAITKLKASLDTDPDRPDTRYNLAAALFQVGRRSEARAHLETLVEEHPRHTLGRTLFARLLVQEEQFETATEHLEEALEIDPEASHIHFGIADLRRRQGRLNQALEAYTQAGQLAPDDPRGAFGQGLILAIQGHYEEAIARAEQGLIALPSQPVLEALLARLLTSPHAIDTQRGVQLAGRALEKQPTITHVEAMAMALAGSGRFEEAISWQEKALQSVNGTHPAHQRLQSRLDLYRAGKPCPQPWLVDEHPLALRISQVVQVSSTD